jgi:hypothetical protein
VSDGEWVNHGRSTARDFDRPLLHRYDLESAGQRPSDDYFPVRRCVRLREINDLLKKLENFGLFPQHGDAVTARNATIFAHKGRKCCELCNKMAEFVAFVRQSVSFCCVITRKFG